LWDFCNKICQVLTHAARQNPSLFDDLIGAAGQGQRDGDAQRLGGLEVDEELDLGCLLDRQVRGLFALEDVIDITCRAPELVDRIGPVGDQAADLSRRARPPTTR
jgi:hypothetical protein